MQAKQEALWYCARKTSYPSKVAARMVARHVRNDGGPRLVVYKCQSCDGWHIAKRREPR